MGKSGRKRQFVRVEWRDGEPVHVGKGGREVDGLSYDKTNQTYYRRIDGKKENLGRDLGKALLRMHPPASTLVVDKTRINLSFPLKRSMTLAEQDSDEFRALVDKASDAAKAILEGEQRKPQPQASKQKLSHCLKEWQALRSNQGRLSETIRVVASRFQTFVDLVGDKPINQLEADDFRRWEDYVTKESKQRSNKWYKDMLGAVRTILINVRRKKLPEGWPFPSGLQDWLDTYRESMPYVPAKSNAAPMPPATFKKLLAVCDTWAAADIDADKTTQSGKAKRNHQKRRRRDGDQWRLILSLACGCSFDNVDVCNLTWSCLRLSAKVPHHNMSRYKTAWRIGSPTDRLTPILPSIVVLLRAWRKQAPKGASNVFLTSRGKPFTSEQVTHRYATIAKEAGVTDFTFKHLRNIGPTLRKRNQLPSDMSDAITGHVAGSGGKRTSVYYEGDVDETYLIPLVNLIGRDYFDGDQIKT